MAKKDTKKEVKPVEKPVVKENPVIVITTPEPEAKAEKINISCVCGYSIPKLNNEGLVGVLCPKCKQSKLS